MRKEEGVSEHPNASGLESKQTQLYNNPQRRSQNDASHHLNAQPPVQDLIAVHIIVINYYCYYYCSVNMLHKLSFFFFLFRCVWL